MKRVITWFLVVFIVVAIVTKIISLNVSQESPILPDGKYIVLFHAKVRCAACIKMESQIKQILGEQKYANLDLVLIEYDRPKNKELVEQFHIGKIAILLLEQVNGQTLRSCNVPIEVWNLFRSGDDSIEILQRKLDEFYGQTRHQ